MSNEHRVGSSAVVAAMRNLFDYAGLFPPSALPMEEAAAAYHSYLTGEDAWMLGRFVVPASRLNELAEAATPLVGDQPWALSVIFVDWRGDLARAAEFTENYVDRFRIEAIETKSSSREPMLEGSPAVYVELPSDSPLDSELAELASHEFAKLRAGGLETHHFPNAAAVARFLASCVRAKVACKATAGLHHPFPANRPTCGADDAPVTAMHGFVNVLLAAALLQDGGPQDEAELLLAEASPTAFSIDSNAIYWRDRCFDVDLIQDTRTQLFHSIGSCSFVTPRDDLRAAGWL